MDVILHVGMHKTGSSSLQSALNGYDDGSTVYASLRAVNHSIPFYSAFSSDHLNYRVFQRQGLSAGQIEALHVRNISDIEKALSRAKRERVIFSGEDISLLGDGDTERMLEHIGRYASDILVVGYFRDPLGFARSALQQVIVSGEAGPDLLQKPNYRFRFEKFLRLLGADKVRLRNFDTDSLVGGDVVDDFIALLELDPERVVRSKENASISLEAQKCVLALNRSNRFTTGDHEVFAARQRFVRVVGSLLGDTDKVPESYLSDCIDLEDLAWLKSATGIDFSAGLASVESKSTHLVDYLTDVDERTIDSLKSFLRRNGTSSRRLDDIDYIVNKIFHTCLYSHFDSHNIAFLNRRLEQADAGSLRDIALKYETGERLDRNDALYLMGLSRKANPSNQAVRRKLREWRKRD